MAIDDYHVRIFEQELEAKKPIDIRETGIIGATTAQAEAIREVAREMGFKDLRGFNTFMKSMDIDYYDIIKIKYQE